MRLKIEFDLVEDVEKQEKDCGIKPEFMSKYKSDKERFYKKHMEDIKEAIKKEFTFDEYEWVENLKIRVVEE